MGAKNAAMFEFGLAIGTLVGTVIYRNCLFCVIVYCLTAGIISVLGILLWRQSR